MRILHIISTMNPKAGGVSQALKTMSMGLIAHADNTIISLDGDEVLSYYKDLLIIPIGKGKTSWNYNVRLQSWLKENKDAFDCVILHGLWQYLSYAVLRTIRSSRASFFVMPHGMLDPYFQNAPERRLKAFRNLFIWNLIEKHLINGVSGLLFTCKTEEILAKQTFKGYAPKNELVVGLGVDAPPAFTQRVLEMFIDQFPMIQLNNYWLFISRIHPKKGLDILIDSYLKLKLERKNRLPQLVIAGPGLETGFGQEMKERASSDPDIIFTGMLTGDLKWGAFYGCSAFILPSHQENFGIAVVEALACRKPVLISDQVNIWREIADSGAGIVKTDTREGVYELFVDWMCLSEQDKINMGIRALQAYEKYFTVEQAAKKTIAALQLVSYA